MKRIGMLLLLVFAGDAMAQACRVVDPELQGVYAGPCVKGLADGYGHATGAAEFSGDFKAGRKHGRGEKRWRNGDRYEGSFVDDRKEGTGTYTWGRGPWQGERYEGAYVADMRHGFGIYRWPTGDVYAGPWERDAIAGYATPMMLARRKFEDESRRAVAKEGQPVCREMPIGIGRAEWLRGLVVAVAEGRVGVRIDEVGTHPHVIAGAQVRKGDVVWDDPWGWTPCYQ